MDEPREYLVYASKIREFPIAVYRGLGIVFCWRSAGTKDKSHRAHVD
jgi:hypothetical protein